LTARWGASSSSGKTETMGPVGLSGKREGGAKGMPAAQARACGGAVSSAGVSTGKMRKVIVEEDEDGLGI
jgi:hypothetical protein